MSNQERSPKASDNNSAPISSNSPPYSIPSYISTANPISSMPSSVLQANNESQTTMSSGVAPPPNGTISASDSSLSSVLSLAPSSSVPPPPTSATLLSHNYSVATHSVRITKHGYAIDPVELKCPEITNKLSLVARRSSQLAFDASQIGHKILTLIRGFWSQPAFPRGRFIRTPDNLATIDAIISSFNQSPFYPHQHTVGSVGKKQLSPTGCGAKSLSPRFGARPRPGQHHGNKVKKLSVASKVTTSGSLDEIVASAVPTQTSPLSSSYNDDSTLNKDIRDKFLTLTVQQQQSLKTASPSLLPFLSGTPPSSLSAQKSVGPVAQAHKSVSNDTKNKLQRHQHHHHHHQQQLQNTYHSWIPKNKDLIAELVSDLCQQVGRIFASESRVINVSSPCVVLGDIHGNLTDLRTYERSLWPKAPICVSCNYLFLGDYVDRGDYSVECILYLFAMKLISPQRFFLLRGNHEVAAIQRQYTFSRECETKFGSVGRQLWLSFNKVFDVMPIVAIIDNQIYCAHGGIPRSITDIKKLADEIPTPLDNPEFQSPAAWEILWNDPITDSELVAMIEMDNTVVTQTHTSETQPTPDGSHLITTTTDSTAITSEVPATKHITSGKESTDTKADKQQENKDKQATKKLIKSIDSVLGPGTSTALSFYIRPDNQSNDHSSDLTKAKTVINSHDDTKQSTTSSSTTTTDNDDTTLRSMPSDTSSIASTSPQQIFNDGFVANIKRGTAFLFSDQAINNFLKVNKLSHVIRAHEVIPTGFAFHGDGRVITIFSSSKYCGLNNQAACVLVDGDKIRILRLDTGDAGE